MQQTDVAADFDAARELVIRLSALIEDPKQGAVRPTPGGSPTLAVHPDDWALLRRHPALLPRRVHEDNVSTDPVLMGVVLVADESAERIAPPAP